MANKKFRIKRNQLPPVESDNKYSARFRIISEDKNRVSHWSPIYILNSTPPVGVDGGLVVNGSVITAVWGDEEGRPQYDVFVNFDSAGYQYHGTTPIHSYTFLNEASSTVRVTVQITGAKKEINPTLKIFESAVTPV